MKIILFLLTSLCSLFSMSQLVVFDFKEANSTIGWFVVNDGVMGGLSEGSFELNEEGNALFRGYVTTENNGGFTSVRYSFKPEDVSEFSKVLINLKGDGKAYQFRLKESEYQRFSYIQYFETTGDWEIIEIPLSEFYPSFRGNRLNRPNFPGEQLAEITFLIGNKVKERFSLEIKSISLQ